MRFVGLLLLFLTSPLWPLLYVLVRSTSKGPFLFTQKRMGKGKKIFTMYKIRTMVVNAEWMKKKYEKHNEVDGPMFKIKNDPRYTKVGKFFSHIGIDELPQLINVLKGEMAIVGPRPLPIEEASQIPKKYEARFTVLPGITSPWVVKGSHRLGFKRWMELDSDYIKSRSTLGDLIVLVRTILLVIKNIPRKLFDYEKSAN